MLLVFEFRYVEAQGLTEVHRGTEASEAKNVYQCDEQSECLIVPFKSIGLKLDSEIKKGRDGCRIFLYEAGVFYLLIFLSSGCPHLFLCLEDPCRQARER